jgi:hypothetical protein
MSTSVNTAAGTTGTRNHNACSWCALAIILALVIGVGLVSHTLLHHVVQTLPLWIVVLFARRPAVRWFGLPCFLFWLAIMAMIWLFLLHLPSPINGHFSPLEVAMTLIVGVACVVALASSVRIRGTRLWTAAMAFVLGAAAQYVCFRISLIPAIWNR